MMARWGALIARRGAQSDPEGDRMQKFLIHGWLSIAATVLWLGRVLAAAVDYACDAVAGLWAVAFPATEAIERTLSARSTETIVHLRGLSRTRAFRDRLLSRPEPSVGRGSGAGVGTLAFAA